MPEYPLPGPRAVLPIHLGVGVRLVERCLYRSTMSACRSIRLTSESFCMNRNATFAYDLPTGDRVSHSIMRYQWKLVPRSGLTTLRSIRNWESPLSSSSTTLRLLRMSCDVSKRRACTSWSRYNSSSLYQSSSIRWLTSSSARSKRFTANARTRLSVKPGPSNSRASSTPIS
jgi:hypothetical protein